MQPVLVASAAAAALRRLHATPAKVDPGLGAGGDEVDFLPAVLADVADPQIARSTIKAPAPRIAEPVGPDLRARAGLPDERVVGRNGIRVATVHVQTQQLAEQRPEIL